MFRQTYLSNVPHQAEHPVPIQQVFNNSYNDSCHLYAKFRVVETYRTDSLKCQISLSDSAQHLQQIPQILIQCSAKCPYLLLSTLSFKCLFRNLPFSTQSFQKHTQYFFPFFLLKVQLQLLADKLFSLFRNLLIVLDIWIFGCFLA